LPILSPKSSLHGVPKTLWLIAIPLLAALLIAAIFYPGAMSYDTLHALYSARNEVTDSVWPPMVSYVWRAVDLVSLDPSAMHFSQVFLLLFSVFYIVYFFTKSILHASIFLLIYISIPAVLGTMAVIWKDVLMAAFLMSGLGAAIYLSTVTTKRKFVGIFLLAISLIFLGVCSRHNAIAGAVPLIFYVAWLVCHRWRKDSKHVLLSVVILGSVLTGAIFFTKTFFDAYELPGFTRLPSSTQFVIKTVRVLDVAGASVCLGENLFADVAPDLTVDDIEDLYEPKHSNYSKELLEITALRSGITERWLSVAFQHPICFFYNKYQLAKYLTGANKGDQFLITHPGIDENVYGYAWSKSSLRDAAFSHVVNASKYTIFAPWFIYLLSILSLLYLMKYRALTVEYLTIYLSAILYLCGLVALGNAGDARLLFYTTSLLLMFTFLSITEVIRNVKNGFISGERAGR
jgi:hypothetical protein